VVLSETRDYFSRFGSGEERAAGRSGG